MKKNADILRAKSVGIFSVPRRANHAMPRWKEA
jgi:hypothetical protein